MSNEHCAELCAAPAGTVGVGRWGYAVLGLVMMIFLGLVYAWSIFVPPLEAEFGWSRSQTSMAFTFCMLFFCLGGLGAGLAVRKVSARFLSSLCAVFIGAGFVLAAGCDSLFELYIFYGILIGSGVGIGYNVLITSMLKWFPDRIGFVGGLMLMGFGAGGMILGTGCSQILAEYGWRNTFWGIGIFYAVFFVLASIFVKAPPPGAVFPAPPSSRNRARESGGEVSTAQMVRRCSFQLYFIWAVCMVGIGFMLIGHGVPVAMELGAQPAAAAAVAGMISLFNGLGRVSGGLVFDNLGRRVLMCSSCTGMLFTSAVLFLAIRQHSIPLLTAAFILGGLSFGFCVIAHSSVVSSFYGMQHYPLNFSVLTLYNLLAAFGPFLVGLLHTALNSYLGLPAVILALASVGLVTALAIKKP